MDTLTDPPTSATELRITALERQLAGLAGRLELAEQQNLTLEAQVARLATDAFTVITLEQMIAASVTGCRPAAAARPRHLHVAGAR